MDKKIQDLVEISRNFGRNADYIIGGGGNTSFKNDEKIWVKASGTSMADIDDDGFVCLDRKKLKIISTKIYSEDSSERESQVKKDLADAILFPLDKRPSVETSMHEIIRFSFVVHTHPTIVNGLLCAVESKELILKLFGDDVLYVDYTDPGYVLFKAVDNALNDFRSKKREEPSIIFLENHGVFVGANSVEEINEKYLDINEKLTNQITQFPKTSKNKEEKIIEDVRKNLSQYSEISNLTSLYLNNDLSAHFVKDKQAFEKVAVPFTPDNIVYCKSKYLFIEDSSEIIQRLLTFKQLHGYYPKVIAIKDSGIIALEENKKSARIVLDVFEDMMKVSYLTENFGGPRPMTQSQIDFIDNWEVENYRRQVSKSS